jgi:hypothetical protein
VPVVQRYRDRQSWRAIRLALAVLVVSAAGCAAPRQKQLDLPGADQFEREQLRIYSDIKLPRRHRLIDELAGRRADIAERLLLPMSDEPISVYVFESAGRFEAFMARNYPLFPKRRAIFVKNDTELCVYAYWGAQAGDDLRHEVTHGYLHSVISNIPLWLDEGLAEYFEQPRGREKFHRQHVAALVDAAKHRNWVPDLKRLETLKEPAEMTQLDYAESWLWVHYLLESNSDNCKTLQDQLARLRMTGEAEPLSAFLEELDPQYVAELIDHLGDIAQTAADNAG